ncbi:MAG TPA: hypothetical protein VK077_09090, partial [Virgibacillus sp.]|nr:hypothetical protein [Virgibacillus sp.]
RNSDIPIDHKFMLIRSGMLLSDRELHMIDRQSCVTDREWRLTDRQNRLSDRQGKLNDRQSHVSNRQFKAIVVGGLSVEIYTLKVIIPQKIFILCEIVLQL